ncbi:sodium:solute symporter family protein [Sedimentibacter sp. zth1]|uniref:sodium:solute symporter family protein n=1 Tax=Sedimentibacter sp. zth1 TaxID=2816908 RepID=UPI001A91E1E1|nr:sodium:solute symporter family protein [Sedimentibacter sp. zth1]QSX06284.1 sodium:solute symporter family protein [Sedimentibacter sp. zth1]
MIKASPIIICCVFIYLIFIVGVGFYLSKKKVKNSDDFAVASRSLPAVILIGTLLATWCGAGGITGSANLIWQNGPLFGILIFMGAPIGMLLLYFVSGRIRKATTYTIPELFEIRYGTSARVISTICIVLGYIGILASQFKAAGYLINLTTGLDVQVAVICSGILMVVLAITGGMFSVAFTDAISAFLFVGGFLIAIPILSNKIDVGFLGMFKNLPAGKNSFIGNLNIIQAIGYIFPIFFLILGDQNMIQRMGAAKNVKTAKRSGLGLVISEVIVCTIIIVVVTTGIYLLPQIDKPDTVIFQLAINFLPPIIGGVLMAACMAFVVTTGDSYVLSISSNITYDIWNRFIKKDATDKQKLKFLRCSAVGVAVLAYVLGRFFPDILSVQMYAYSMYGASITPALICALFSKNVTKVGGLCGIIAGGLGTILWEIILRSPFGIKSAIITVPLAFIVIYVVSYFTKNSESVPIEKIYINSDAIEE